MKLLLPLAFTCALTHCSVKLHSQFYFYDTRYYEPAILLETGLLAGGMNCLTDLGGKPGTGGPFVKDLNLPHTRICIGIFADILYNYKWGLQLGFTWGNLYASDKLLQNDNSIARARYRRNLHFRSRLLEWSLQGEWHILSQWMQWRIDKIPRFSPYLIAGIGIYHFNPEANLSGNWISLQPLRTEGQGFREYPLRHPYRLTQLNIPVGIGIRHELSAIFGMRLEMVQRFLFTDYLDDVSTQYPDPALFLHYLNPSQAVQAIRLSDRRKEIDPQFSARANEKRGNSQRNDCYFTVQFKLCMALNRKRRV